MSEPRDQRRDCGSDAGAYVLGALEPAEAERFVEHMRSCVVCRDEVAALSSVAQALPLAAPQLSTPRRLRRRVLAQAAGERRRRGARRARPRRVVWPTARAALAGGGALAIAAAIVIAVLSASGKPNNARVVTASVSVPSARASVRLGSGRAELVVRGMPAAPAGRIYEVWLARASGAPAPTSSLFDVTSSGSATVDVPGNLRGVRDVLVTLEPRGGSLHPTSKPVIVARLT